MATHVFVTHHKAYWLSRERQGQREWVTISLLINERPDPLMSCWECLLVTLGNMVS